ncbi:uncharacterized protein DUF3331 [Paraburkholderia unamae]|uniref:Uncharacterized protein DUF3331 n=2 Tax=Paraburkholderia unamae TaxID=219649 RepID=A0ABX5KJZ4_9BURK|nr:DUF3331 domain-containing protein [Paraburkholderia unamae]PVX81859.1 uncharacterized protein DUF3331 [Paraburkholderia unamae]CAG9258585.1 hypothetical protein PUN4_320033 [Paraburkholderia unamae]
MNTIPPGFSQTEPTLNRDAWMDTITVLEALTARNCNPDVEPVRRDTVPPASKPRRKVPGDDVTVRRLSHAVVTVVERVTDRSILLNWCDPTSCHYSDQLWTKRSARRSGHCALTGESIARGDAVYAPYTRVSNPPANEQAMILASSVKD